MCFGASLVPANPDGAATTPSLKDGLCSKTSTKTTAAKSRSKAMTARLVCRYKQLHLFYSDVVFLSFFQDAILVDEFEPGKLMPSVLKRMTDVYPCTLPGRGISKTWRGMAVFFTAQMHPREFFVDAKGKQNMTDFKAFARRCTAIWHCSSQIWTPELTGRAVLTGNIAEWDKQRFQPFGNPFDDGTVFNASSPAWIPQPPSSSSASSAAEQSSETIPSDTEDSKDGESTHAQPASHAVAASASSTHSETSSTVNPFSSTSNEYNRKTRTARIYISDSD